MVIKNYLYNLMYQVITIILPIITIPYVSRILGPSGIGEYSLSSAYAQYFILFGMIGLSMYSSREIAYVRDDRSTLNKVFWELNILKFITMGISTLLYILIFIILFKNNNRLLYLIQTTLLLSYMFDISWLFIGLEDFKKVAIRNTIVKITGVFLIFIFIKDSSQVYLYALILGGTQLIGQIIMWVDIPKEIKFKIPKNMKILRHLKFSLKLFIPEIAINIYTTMDKIMLGTICNDTQVGLYDNSQKIIKLLIAIVTTLATVMIPKMASLYKNGEIEEFKKNIYNSMSFVTFVSIPMAFGLIAIADNFTYWFYGVKFEGIKPMFYYGAWTMIALAWSSVIGSQVLISIKRDKQFSISVTLGAIVNLIFNIVLIKRFQGIGTTISSVIAEFTGVFLMCYFVRDTLNLKKMFKGIFKYFFASAIMGFIIFWIGKFLWANIFGTIIQVVLGLIIYLLIMYFLKDKNVKYILYFIEKVMRNSKRKFNSKRGYKK